MRPTEFLISCAFGLMFIGAGAGAIWVYIAPALGSLSTVGAFMK